MLLDLTHPRDGPFLRTPEPTKSIVLAFPARDEITLGRPLVLTLATAISGMTLSASAVSAMKVLPAISSSSELASTIEAQDYPFLGAPRT